MTDPQLDPEIEKALLSGTDARRRLRPEIVRFFSSSFSFRKDFFLLRLILAAIVIWGFVQVQNSPPRLDDYRSGRFIVEKLLHTLEKSVYVNSRRFAGEKTLVMGEFTTNVASWKPLGEVYEKWVIQRFPETLSQDAPLRQNVRLDIELRRADKGGKVLLNYSFSDESTVKIPQVYVVPGAEPLWGPIIGFSLILLTGSWTFSVIVGLLTGIVMENGGNLVKALEVFSDLFFLSVGHFYFWALLSLIMVSVFFNFDRLGSNFGKLGAAGNRLSVPASLLLAPVFPWALVILSRFLVTFRIPRSGLGGVSLLLSAMAGSLLFLPMNWGIEWNQVFTVFHGRMFSVMALTLALLAAFSSKLLTESESERLTNFPFRSIGIDEGYSEKGKVRLGRFLGKIILGLLILVTLQWWVSEVSRIEFLILKIRDLDLFTENLNRFFSAFVISFLTGSGNLTSEWLLMTDRPGVSGIGVGVSTFSYVVDGAFWGGLISPFGLPCFLIALGFGLSRVNFLRAVWVVAIPLTIWASVFILIGDLAGIPAMITGVISGLIFAYLIVLYNRLRFMN